MARKKFICLALGACLLGGGILFLVFGPLRDPISPRTCARIQLGMTELEVQSILGKPADHEYHPWEVACFLQPTPGTDPEWEKMWLGEDWMVFIHLDGAGQVCNRGCLPAKFDNQPETSFSWRRFWRW